MLQHPPTHTLSIHEQVACPCVTEGVGCHGEVCAVKTCANGALLDATAYVYGEPPSHPTPSPFHLSACPSLQTRER